MGKQHKHCNHADGCEMYELFGHKSTLRVWQLKYCEGEFERCARYQAAIGGRRISPNLLPNGKLLTLHSMPAVKK
jgi:hypothetical protein